MSRKKHPPNAPVALGILRALDPPHSEDRFLNNSETGHRDRDRDREKDLGEKKEKWAFWNRDKEREKEKERERDRERDRVSEREREGMRGKERKEDEGQAELTRMISMIKSFIAAIMNMHY